MTPEPGGNYFVRADVDRRLGRLWEEAEVRLRARSARAGILAPAGLVVPDPSALDLRPCATAPFSTR